MYPFRTVVKFAVTIAMASSTPSFAQTAVKTKAMPAEHMQQHMTAMSDMMRQMSEMGKRAEDMQQQMKQPTGGMAMGGQMGAHMTMPPMAEHMSGMTTHMMGMMEQMQSMMKDSQMPKDPKMQHDMDDMQMKLGAMSQSMSKMLTSMENMHKHMGTTPPPKKP